MTSPEGIYEQFPFPEVMKEQAGRALARLQLLVLNTDVEPTDDERAAEVVSDSEHFPHITTELEVFVPMYAAIHPILMETEVPPKYVIDAFCAMARAFEMPGREAGGLPLPNDEGLREVFLERWQQHEAERTTAVQWSLFRATVGRLNDVQVCFVPGGDVWKLGYVFAEQRHYELYGKYASRVLEQGGHFFTDPVGSEGDRENAAAGFYLPSRLELPAPEEPVKIPYITLIPPRTRPD